MDAKYSYGKEINVGHLKFETLDKALTMHANKEPSGQYQTQVTIHRNTIRNLMKKITSLQPDETQSSKVRFKADKKVLENTGEIWSTLTRSHKYQYKPAAYQLHNEPSSSKPHYFVKVVNGLYDSNSTKYSQ